MSGTIATNLPDDDEPLPRRRPAIDEVHQAHAVAGIPLPPLSATSHLGPDSSPQVNPMAAPMAAPMASPMTSPMTSPMAAPMTSPLGNGTIPLQTTVIDTSGVGNMNNMMNQQTMQMNSMAATAQAQASVGLAQTSIDEKIVDEQMKKEDEHWMKSFWRPAMGWLYMLICFCDFIVFPAITMFLPVIDKIFGFQMNYVPWQSLTLSNGGLIHLSFGAILGVSAYGRTQEKKA